MTRALLAEAVSAGARQGPACKVLGVDPPTVQRWPASDAGVDGRAGPRTCPANKLSDRERQELLAVVNAPEHRDLSPKQIVPRLADQGQYLASESTMYRVLRAQGQMHHREVSRKPSPKPREQVATGPNQVWSWDITYLKGPIKGHFIFLYLVLDVWSRKIVGWAVHEIEDNEYAARLIEETCAREGIRRDQIVLHQDNGSPMKGATFLATLQWLGVEPSYSRPHVSDDNPYSESLFRTLKGRPHYPSGRFAGLQEAFDWVASFVRWYNTVHRHSAVRYVTPEERHEGREHKILAHRREVYERARRRKPERWNGRAVRDWTPVAVVKLNPAPETASEMRAAG